MPVSGKRLVLVRSGRFSGSAISLRDELKSRVELVDVDLQNLGYDLKLVLGRTRAISEARLAGGQIPWARTASWTTALERRCSRLGVFDGATPILFVQSAVPMRTGEGLRYFVYTDRVGAEGVAVGGSYRSRHTDRWRELERRFLRSASRVFVMGPSTKKVLSSDAYGLDVERVHVVGAGPNCGLTEARAAGGQCRRVLFVGTNWAAKGGPELMEAFSRVRADNPEMELVIVGSAPNGAIPPGVSVLGTVAPSLMDSVYSGADVLAIPTHMEAFGISFVEALLKGIPCIGTSVGNQAWIIRDAGICIEPGNVAALAEAFRVMVRDYSRFQSAALTRSAVLREEMRWSSVAESIVRLALDEN